MIRNAVIPLDQLLPDELNPKQHSPENIARLVGRIKAVGFTSPVLVDEKTGLLKAGHRRRLALYWLRENHHPEPDGIESGWGVPARVGSWSELQRLQVLIGDNEDPAEIEFDTAGLTALLAELQTQDGLEGAGYDAARLDELIAAVAGENGSGNSAAPETFPSYGEEIQTDFCCPKCGYRWSGFAAVPGTDDAGGGGDAL